MHVERTTVISIITTSIIFSVFASTQTNNSDRASKEEKYRLPKAIIPLAYNINIVPFLDNNNFTFNGDVWIRFLVVEETSVVSLHYNDTDEITSKDIEMFHSNISITPPNVLYINYNKETNRCDVNMGTKLTSGVEYTIRIKYKGYIRDDMQGLFRSSYITNAGETRWIAATHLTPLSARRVFPCFDEPSMKATFNISVARTVGRKTLSNMPIASVSNPDPDLDGMVWDHFQETGIPISPHMVAIFITDFTSKSNDIVTIWERSDAASQADYSASISSSIIKGMENITGYKYMLTKMDEVAIPDYHIEAKGQLGLIAHRERFLLYDKDESTSSDKQNIAMALAQEISEMWFGNLISLKWWDYLWINEGFQNYFKYFAIVDIEKDWHMEEQFIVKSHHKALAADSLNTSHALTASVIDFNEIISVFDDISYLKAASIIRMMKHIVTPDTFQKGVNRYLQTIGNRSAEPDDLFSALQAQYTEDVHLNSFDLKTVMGTWTKQMGYPLLTVTRDYNKGVISVEQEKFLIDEAVNGSDTNDYKWWIPLTYTTQSMMNFENTETKDWLKASDDKRDLLNVHVSNDDWIIFNIQQTGFYRVNYDETNWKHIAKFLNSNRFNCIPPINRAQILDDAFNLARAGYLSYEIALEVINYLERETDYIPWHAALSGLSFIDQRLKGASDDDYQTFKDFVLKLINNVYNTLGFGEKNDDDHITKLHRNLIMTWACNIGKYDCISKSIRTLADVIEDSSKNRVSPDMKSVVYCNSVKYGGVKEWDNLWSRFHEFSNVASEQVLILEALGCSRDETIIHRYMSLSLNKSSGIRSQDESLVFPSVYSSHGDGVDFAISFLLNNYRVISEYHNSVDAVVSLISSISGVVFKETQISKLKEFVNENKSYLGNAATEASLNALYTAEKNVDWLNSHYKSIVKFSNDHVFCLPESCIPVMYTLKLDPYFTNKNFTFSGEVEIIISVTEPTNRIVLNARDLNINSSAIIVISLTTGLQVPVLYAVSYNENERYMIKLKNDLIVGHKYEVSMVFSGYLRNDLVGFYRSSYSAGNEIRWLAATQFETTYARYAFPCFDEPALKAIFRVSIARDSNYNIIFNMPLVSSDIISTETSERILDTFEETPVMSSYLLEFIVSDFTKSTSGSTSTWQRKEVSSQAKYSISISQPIVSTLEAFLEVGYELPKLDQVAVPDLSAVAMENWGLITYRESYLLIDEVRSSSADRQIVALQIAHEIAHQWFGNLVSPKWWYYAWLNEGFAFYFQYHALAKVETTWRLEDQFVLHGLQKSFSLDSYKESRAMTYKVDKPSQIPIIFDIILYEKAGSVIRMISHSISAETFRKGLNKYLKNLSHSSADTTSLANYLKLQLQEESKTIEIEAILESWSTQMGYPVITVWRNYDSGNVSVTQERFVLSNMENIPCDHEYKWWIPLTYTSKSNADFNNTEAKLWINTNSVEITNIAANADEWVIFNIQEAGYYRVNYDVQNWQLIISHMLTDNFTDIHVLNRAQILDDALNLARSGMLDYSIALDLTKYLPSETDYIPWKSAFTAFSFIDLMMKDSASYEMFKNYTVSLMDKLYESLGMEEKSEDDHLTKLLRLEVLDWMCKVEVPDCVSNATEFFSLFMSDPEKYRISPDIAEAIYCTALAVGGESEWNFLYKYYEDSNVETEKVVVLKSLGCSKNLNVLQRYLEAIMSENSKMKTHLKSTALTSIYSNPVGTDIVLNIMTENYDVLSKCYSIGNSVDEVFVGVAQMLRDQAQIKKMQNFLSDEKSSVCNTILSCKKVLGILEHNSQWIENRMSKVEEWLSHTDSSTSEPDSVSKFCMSWMVIFICSACLLVLGR